LAIETKNGLLVFLSTSDTPTLPAAGAAVVAPAAAAVVVAAAGALVVAVVDLLLLPQAATTRADVNNRAALRPTDHFERAFMCLPLGNDSWMIDNLSGN
jgi:hypothetical protein